MSHTARDQRSSDALRKADKFAAENDRGRRVQAKQAILLELNAQLKARSERLQSQYVASCSRSLHYPSRFRLNCHCILYSW